MQLECALVADPNDAQLIELGAMTVADQRAQAADAADPFWANYPGHGQLATTTEDRVRWVTLPSGSALTQSTRPFSNVLLVGPTRWAKTNMLRRLVIDLLAAGAIVVVFDPKGDFAECETLTREELPFYVFDWKELPLAFFQPPPGLDLDSFINTKIACVLGAHQRLAASKRLAVETARKLFAEKAKQEKKPRLSDWIAMVAGMSAPARTKLGDYAHSLLYALKEIEHSALGEVLDFAESSFLEDLFTGSARALVVRTGGLTGGLPSILAHEFISYAYDRRRVGRRDADRPVVFILDDAVSMLRGGAQEFRTDELNPIGEWALKASGFGVYFVGAVQFFRGTSPAFVQNCHTVISVGSTGDDAAAIARHLDLKPEQAAVLPMLRPGQAIVRARTEWPHAVYGRHELVP